MKKHLIVLLIFSMCIPVSGQTHMNDLVKINGLWVKKGETKPYTGKYIDLYDDGTMKGEGEFKDGQFNGIRIMYNEDGKKNFERNYKARKYEGLSIEYYPGGQIKQEAYFKKGEQNGVLKTYYDNGQVHVITTISDGVQEGEHFEYSRDGKLIAQCYFTNGSAGYSPEFLELTAQASKLSKQLKTQEAIKMYDKAIALNPTVAQAYHNRGTCKGNTLDIEGALEDLDKAIELKPDFQEAYTSRGYLKINAYNLKASSNSTQEELVASACEDLHKAISLGDNSMATIEMIRLNCTAKKKQ